MKLQLSNQTKQKSRTVYRFLDMLGDVGGLADAIFMFNLMILGFFTPSFFATDMVGSVFNYRSCSEHDQALATQRLDGDDDAMTPTAK